MAGPAKPRACVGTDVAASGWRASHSLVLFGEGEKGSIGSAVIPAATGTGGGTLAGWIGSDIEIGDDAEMVAGPDAVDRPVECK